MIAAMLVGAAIAGVLLVSAFLCVYLDWKDQEDHARELADLREEAEL